MRLSEFDSYLAERGRSANTIRAYVLAVRSFERWYQQTNGAALTPAALTRAEVRDWREHLYTVERLSVATINFRLAALRAWGAWLVASGQLVSNPAADVSLIPQVKLAPRWPERKDVYALERELERAVNNARTEPAKTLATRDHAMIKLMINTGLRVGELCALVAEDLKLGERSGAVSVRRGKGDKARTVPLNVEARRALSAWLGWRPAAAAALFTDLAGVPLTARAVQYVLKEYSRRAGVSITPHQLRHYLAKSLIDAGVSLTEIAALLGHSKITTTQIYTQPGAADLERAVSRLDY